MDRQRQIWQWLLLKLCLVSLLKEDNNQTKGERGTHQHQPIDDKLEREADNLPTMVDIKKVIPRHCFEPKVSTSMSYVALDATAIVVLYVVFEWVRSSFPWYTVCLIAPLFWLLQGTLFTAIFVLGHDCGHGSFSKSDVLNDVMGTILHTFLMVPYYCWKISHRNHHKHTGNIDKDEVFYPTRKKDSPVTRTLLPGFGLGIGWYAYLAMGYGSRPVYHYNFLHRAFSRHVLACAVSVSSLAVWVAILYHYTVYFGWGSLMIHYVIPAFVFASWGVVFTFLHHTDENVPWFSDQKWNFVLGQLSSIDREYGWAHRLTHDIGTHQIHHLFTKVPHYHLHEATRAFRRHFPHLVRYSRAPIIPTFIKMFRKYVQQHVIADDADFHTYK
ncbi:sn-1 acyl-lipid omega-3 desaturase (ferredoxin)-like [Liolophura sinensis]|uniref:sn-1 acyl-lipid omega-3 desaturase (ferredoxin)-like n=1 Tax=Liolophura sinensis TaxID=3198878 RepID=UPI0031580B36